MTHKVIQWATGQVGKSAVLGIAGHPDLELVGAWVHSAEKEGRDVGELCGGKPLGVLATRDKDALLAMPADCVCYTAGRSWMRDPSDALAELVRILRAGKNVVNATWPALVYPRGLGEDVQGQLQEACLEGGSTFFTAGIDPGFGGVGIALSALAVTSEVRCVRTYEILNYANWDQPEMITLFGFGQSDPAKCALFTPGYTAGIFGSSLTLLADAMGVQLDDVVEDHQLLFAEESFDVARTHIAAGTICGARFQVIGLVDGEPRVVVDHVTKLRDEDFPEVRFEGEGYRAEVEGEPEVRLDLALTSRDGDPGYAALRACAMTLVNAIPWVVAAEPGVLSYLDLPPHPSKNLPRGR